MNLFRLHTVFIFKIMNIINIIKYYFKCHRFTSIGVVNFGVLSKSSSVTNHSVRFKRDKPSSTGECLKTYF